MKIAVVGCVHGKLKQIYEDVQNCEKHSGFLIDLVIICGDFQAVRNANDMKCMAIKDKYKELGDFHKFFKGQLEATHLTLVIGGNHEASNYFQQLPYGGWIAKNIFYMGYSNVVKVNGVRIAGISGIYNHHDVLKGHFEHLPYTQSSMRSIYHTRYLEVFRMLQVQEKLDVLFTHDWPLRIYNQQPKAREFLLKKKPGFREDIENNRLGNPLYEILLNRIRPKQWFSAHLHIRFQTNYVHQSNEPNKVEKTHFLALDKCLPRRTYLELVNIQNDEFNTNGLEYDLEWLAILKLTNEFVSCQEYPSKQIPQPHIFMNYDLDDAKIEIRKKFNNDFHIPHNFSVSLPLHEDGSDIDPNRQRNFVNDQSAKFCELLDITDPNQRLVSLLEGKVNNPDRISISDDDGEGVDWIEDVKPDDNLQKMFSNTRTVEEKRNVTIINVTQQTNVTNVSNHTHHTHNSITNLYNDPSGARINRVGESSSTIVDPPLIQTSTITNCNELLSENQIEVNGVIINLNSANNTDTNGSETNEQPPTDHTDEQQRPTNHTNEQRPAEATNGNGYEKEIKKENSIPDNQQERQEELQQEHQQERLQRVKQERQEDFQQENQREYQQENQQERQEELQQERQQRVKQEPQEEYQQEYQQEQNNEIIPNVRIKHENCVDDEPFESNEELSEDEPIRKKMKDEPFFYYDKVGHE